MRQGQPGETQLGHRSTDIHIGDAPSHHADTGLGKNKPQADAQQGGQSREQQDFHQKETRDLATTGAQGPKDACFPAALDHSDGDRVIDQIHADEQGHAAHQRQTGAEMAEQDLNLSSPPGRGVDVITGGQSAFNARLHGSEVLTGQQADVDPVEPPLLAKGQLGGIEIHDGDIATCHPGRPLGIEQTAHLEGLQPGHGLNADLLIDTDPDLCRHGPGEKDGIPFGQEEERIRDLRRLVGDAVIADVVVLEDIDAEDHQGPLLAAGQAASRLDHRYRVFDTRQMLHPLKNFLGKAGISAGDLEHGPAGGMIDRILAGPEHAPVHQVDGHHGGHPEADAGHGQEDLHFLQTEVLEADMPEQVDQRHGSISPMTTSSARRPSCMVMTRLP